MQKKAILSLYGSFNPITIGHVKLGEAAYDYVQNTLKMEVDQVLFIPTNDKYPYKKLTNSVHRCAMIELAIQNSSLHSKMMLEKQDIEHHDFRPTADSINALCEKYNDYNIFIIAGSDMLQFMCDNAKWSEQNIQEMFEKAHLIAFTRNCGCGAVQTDQILEQINKTPHLQKHLNSKIHIVDKNISAASSTAVRSGSDEFLFQNTKLYISEQKLF